MNKIDEKKRDEIMDFFERIARSVMNDPEVIKLAEENQRKYGTLTEEDGEIIFNNFAKKSPSEREGMNWRITNKLFRHI